MQALLDRLPATLQSWTEQVYLNNSVLDWLLALLAVIIVYAVIVTLRRVLRGRLLRLAKRTDTPLDDTFLSLLGETRWFFFLGMALYVGLQLLTLRPETTLVVQRVFVALLLLQVLFWGNRAISFLIDYKTHKDSTSASERTTLSAINFISRLILYSLLVLMALDNFGFDITTLIAGLGITSVAVALAVQNILGDLFASLSIVLDKPFEIGDFIVVGDFSGSIEKIGLRSTRVRSLSGEQLVFANKDLLESRIRNFKRMQERRTVFDFGVRYGTAPDKLRKIPDIVREAVTAQGKVRFDRAHLKEFGDYALNFEVVYFMLEPDFTLYMDTQQAINVQLLEVFKTEGIEFALPTQRVLVSPEEKSAD